MPELISDLAIANLDDMREEIDRRTFVRRLFALGAAFAGGRQLAAAGNSFLDLQGRQWTPIEEQYIPVDLDAPFNGVRLVRRETTVTISRETMHRLRMDKNPAAFLAWAERELETQKKLLSGQLQRQWGL